MYKLTFTLKQHTPIIHFQTDVKGATIRPTEFKSKLDRFLIGKWTGCYGIKEVRLKEIKKLQDYRKFLKNGYDFDDPENADPQVPALDYKVEVRSTIPDKNNINALELQTAGIRDDFKLYFGNMGNQNPIKKKFSFHDEVEIIIISTNGDLLDIIRDEITNFLFVTNFGTRQNKGFGSFFLHGTKSNDIIKKDFINSYPCYKFKVDTTNLNALDGQKRLFQHINQLYKVMRAGINRKDKYYFKPTLWHYLQTKNFQWDKKTIKEDFYSGDKKSSMTVGRTDTPDRYNDTRPKNQKYLWRDLLGFSTKQEWRDYPGIGQTDIHNRVMSPIPEYKRYTSPITFKPLRKDTNTFVVFIILDELFANDAKSEDHNSSNFPASDIFGENVEISIQGTSTNTTLSFPLSFNYFEFLRQSFKLTYGQIKLNGRMDIVELQNIFSQLNAQNPYKLP